MSPWDLVKGQPGLIGTVADRAAFSAQVWTQLPQQEREKANRLAWNKGDELHLSPLQERKTTCYSQLFLLSAQF